MINSNKNNLITFITKQESEPSESENKITKFDDDFAIDYDSENDMNQYSAEQEHEWLKVGIFFKVTCLNALRE
jgi:hypothetical protein